MEQASTVGRTYRVVRIWLYLLGEGTCSTASISNALNIDPVIVSKCLVNMRKSGVIKQFSKPGHHKVSVGVTFECKVPKGVVLKDIVKLLGLP